MSKQPYIPLYTGDYMQDTRTLPLNVRGAWIEIMIHMWRSEERGVIVGTMPEFAMMMGCMLDEANFAISLLQQKRICDFEIQSDGFIKLICRRMNREAKTAKARSEAGIEGVKAKKAKAIAKANEQAKTKQNTDNDNGIDTDNESTVFKIKDESEKILLEIEGTLQIALNEIYLDQQRMKWPHLDFDFEYRTFCEKVRGAPGHYRNHDKGGITLAFQNQLRNAKHKPKNGKQTDKATEHVAGLMADYELRRGGAPKG
jgi:uncharacterized protein YdaU (DUF1376 family)